MRSLSRLTARRALLPAKRPEAGGNTPPAETPAETSRAAAARPELEGEQKMTTTTARAALDLMQPAEIIQTLTACYNHARRRADAYNLRADYFDALAAEDVTAAAYIETREILDRLDALPEDDDRRAWPLIRVFVRAVCIALRKTYRAEHGQPSALIYLDALPDNETRAAVIDTAARACGNAPCTPEAAYIAAETVNDALRASCRSDRDRAIIRATAAGISQTETAARLGISQQAVAQALARIRTRAASYRAAQIETDRRNAAERLAQFGQRYAAAERISRAK